MTDSPDTLIEATSWLTPFSEGDRDDLHIVRVDVPCIPWVCQRNGEVWELGEWSGPNCCEIHVFNEADRTVYAVRNEVNEISIYNERDMPFPIVWDSCDTGRTFRLTGTALHRSVSSMMNGDRATYVIATGEYWVEFIARGDPEIEVVRRLPPKLRSM